jgi:hypothetical protein
LNLSPSPQRANKTQPKLSSNKMADVSNKRCRYSKEQVLENLTSPTDIDPDLDLDLALDEEFCDTLSDTQSDFEMDELD